MRKAFEFVDSITLASASTDYYLTNGLPNDYLYWGIYLDVSLRDVVGTAALASILYGSPTTFIEQITVEGNMIGRGRVVVFDMSGRQAWQFVRSLGISGYADPDGFVSAAGATGTYDIRVGYLIPFAALGSVAMERATLLPANMFSNPLTLRIRRGGAESLGINAATSTQTITAYGSSSGSPVVNVSRIIVKEGLGAPQVSQLLCQKLRQGPFSITTSVTDGLIGRLNTGNLIGRIHLMQGTAETDVGQSGELASGTYSAVTRYRLRQNQNVIRNFIPRDGARYAQMTKGLPYYSEPVIAINGSNVIAPGGLTAGFLWGERVGETLIDFCPDGSLDDALDTVLWAARGQSLLLYGDVTGAPNQQVEVITEEYSPVNLGA